MIPKGAVMLTDNKGLQPADNPVFLMRKDKATPAALKIVNAVSAKLTAAAYNKMSRRCHHRQGRSCGRGRGLPEVEQAHVALGDFRRRYSGDRQRC